MGLGVLRVKQLTKTNHDRLSRAGFSLPLSLVYFRFVLRTFYPFSPADRQSTSAGIALLYYNIAAIGRFACRGCDVD